jgi:hypothetical protein
MNQSIFPSSPNLPILHHGYLFGLGQLIKQMDVQMKTKKLQLQIRKYGSDLGIVILLGFVGLQGSLKAIERGNTLFGSF